MRVFLIGFMGAGKSHWGKIWAEKSGMTFFDLDEIIVAKEQMTIDEIFDKKGEDYFRQIESASLQSTLDYDNCIVACGGGTPCFFDNMKWMNENGLTVFIKAKPHTLLQNMTHEMKKRPLFNKINQAEILTFIEQKLKERNEFYTVSKITLSIEELNDSTITDLLTKV
jgi:shikimate kinase